MRKDYTYVDKVPLEFFKNLNPPQRKSGQTSKNWLNAEKICF